MTEGGHATLANPRTVQAARSRSDRTGLFFHALVNGWLASRAPRTKKTRAPGQKSRWRHERRNATASQFSNLTRITAEQTDRINIYQPCEANQAFMSAGSSTQSSRHGLDETSTSGNPQRTKHQAREVQQLANPRRANGARPGLEHHLCLSFFPLPSRTQGLVRPGPMEPDTNKRQPCQIGLAVAAWGNRPLISFVILPRLPGLPLSPGWLLQRRADNRRPLVPAWPPGSAFRARDRGCQRPVPRLVPAVEETARARKGSPPDGWLQFSLHSPSFLTGWSSR